MFAKELEGGKGGIEVKDSCLVNSEDVCAFDSVVGSLV